MRKTRIAILIGLVLLMAIGSAFANSFDFSSVPLDSATDDELIWMHSRIEQIFVDRGHCSFDTIECGLYVVDEDIQPGGYLIYSINGQTVEIYIVDNDNRRHIWDHREINSDVDGPYYISLRSGQLLGVLQHSGVCKPQDEASKSWSPQNSTD